LKGDINHLKQNSKIHKSLVGSVMIDIGLCSEDHSSIPRQRSRRGLNYLRLKLTPKQNLGGLVGSILLIKKIQKFKLGKITDQIKMVG
jgi:hypothetical protein